MRFPSIIVGRRYDFRLRLDPFGLWTEQDVIDRLSGADATAELVDADDESTVLLTVTLSVDAGTRTLTGSASSAETGGLSAGKRHRWIVTVTTSGGVPYAASDGIEPNWVHTENP